MSAASGRRTDSVAPASPILTGGDGIRLHLPAAATALALPLALVALALAFRYLAYAAAAVPFGGLAAAMCQWDCGWYVSVAHGGYQIEPLPDAFDRANWPFFPAFPLLLSAVAPGSWLGHIQAGLVLNGILLAAFVGLAILWSQQTQRTDPRWAGPTELALFLLVWPASFYLSAPLTEALFNTLLLAMLLLWRSGRWLLAGIAAALLSATRPNGVVVVALAALAVALPPLFRLLRARAPADRQEAGLALLQAVAFGALGGLGVAGFMIFLHRHIGDALAFVHVQVAWGHGFENPIATLIHGLRANDLDRLTGNVAVRRSELFAALIAMASLLVIAWLAWTRRWLETAILTATLVVPLSTGFPIGLIGIQRYMLTNPFLILAVWDLVRRLPPTLRGGVFLLLAAAHGWGLWMWYRGAFAMV
ncbi:hypothetical protein LPC08_08495 [Roseomonas sp. OT10]|uniref:hypothetical protein n=1 Tax=Roseomonas cutis TaxID=2897332 RepID=UPI001E5498EF|nr:hypothetical protein [Roseomonas sp. OT10]UFN50640.1 hypothetical protein LPC08_08495 [Roseomonas sp. OT10]